MAGVAAIENIKIVVSAVKIEKLRNLAEKIECNLSIAPEPTSAPVKTPVKNPRRLFGLSVAATVIALLAWFITERFTAPDNTSYNRFSENIADQLPPIDLLQGPTVAVLPFLNIGNNPDNDYLSDGISEEIINALVQQTNLPVVAHTSSFQFKDQAMDSKEIGKRLNASHLLEGSVRKSGATIRITAQLIDAPTGFHLWSNQYDRSIDDLFVIQTEIAGSIVDKIKLQLDAQGEQRI